MTNVSAKFNINLNKLANLNKMDLNKFGTAVPYSWTRDHLLNVLIQGPGKIVRDPLIVNALKRVDRADFVPEEYKNMAYTDQALPIGYDQTISQPTVVAQMIQLLKPREGKKYLEIGSGSGYVTALLALIAGDNGKVYALERNQYLIDMARQNLKKYPDLVNRIEMIFRDGSKGLAEQAPFDFIHSAAAFEGIPNELKNQLVIGGRLVAPTQKNDIRVIERVSPTDFDERIHEGYIFVPIVEGIE